MSDFKTLLNEILAFRDERDWKQFHSPKNLATALGIEAAELQETMLWKTDLEVERLLADPTRHDAVSNEIADVLIYALLFAHAAGIDPANAIRQKLEHNGRKYPADKVRGTQ